MRLLLMVLVLASAARAADQSSRPPRDWRVTGEYLYYLPTNSGSGLADQLGTYGDVLVLSAGYDSTDKNVSNNGGAGGRLSAVRAWDARTELGASVDYVLGPTTNADFHAFSAGLGNGGLTINRAATFVRLLGQAHILLLGRRTPERRPGDWSLEIASAFGPAFGHIDQSCTASGSLTCGINSAHETWIGLAWETGPRVAVHVRDLDVGFAVLAASFPRYKGSASVAPLSWQTVGFSLSAEF